MPPKIREVNVPPHRMRGLLRRCRRWPRPDQKLFSSKREDVFCGVGIPVQFGAAGTTVPPDFEIFFDDATAS